jgi:hypothetical protein
MHWPKKVLTYHAPNSDSENPGQIHAKETQPSRTHKLANSCTWYTTALNRSIPVFIQNKYHMIEKEKKLNRSIVWGLRLQCAVGFT